MSCAVVNRPCPNAQCAMSGKAGKGNIVPYGFLRHNPPSSHRAGAVRRCSHALLERAAGYRSRPPDALTCAHLPTALTSAPFARSRSTAR